MYLNLCNEFFLFPLKVLFLLLLLLCVCVCVCVCMCVCDSKFPKCRHVDLFSFSQLVAECFQGDRLYATSEDSQHARRLHSACPGRNMIHQTTVWTVRWTCTIINHLQATQRTANCRPVSNRLSLNVFCHSHFAVKVCALVEVERFFLLCVCVCLFQYLRILKIGVF